MPLTYFGPKLEKIIVLGTEQLDSRVQSTVHYDKPTKKGSSLNNYVPLLIYFNPKSNVFISRRWL